jgi:hypothetical protein
MIDLIHELIKALDNVEKIKTKIKNLAFLNRSINNINEILLKENIHDTIKLELKTIKDGLLSMTELVKEEREELKEQLSVEKEIAKHIYKKMDSTEKSLIGIIIIGKSISHKHYTTIQELENK